MPLPFRSNFIHKNLSLPSKAQKGRPQWPGGLTRPQCLGEEERERERERESERERQRERETVLRPLQPESFRPRAPVKGRARKRGETRERDKCVCVHVYTKDMMYRYICVYLFVIYIYTCMHLI